MDTLHFVRAIQSHAFSNSFLTCIIPFIGVNRIKLIIPGIESEAFFVHEAVTCMLAWEYLLHWMEHLP
jgi:hypothetical protein